MSEDVQIPGCLPAWAEGKRYVELTAEEYCTLRRIDRATFTRRAAAGRIKGLIREGRRIRVAMNPSLMAAPTNGCA